MCPLEPEQQNALVQERGSQRPQSLAYRLGGTRQRQPFKIKPVLTLPKNEGAMNANAVKDTTRNSADGSTILLLGGVPSVGLSGFALNRTPFRASRDTMTVTPIADQHDAAVAGLLQSLQYRTVNEPSSQFHVAHPFP